jgi:hypothetical protein
VVLRRHRTEPGRKRAAFKRLLTSPDIPGSCVSQWRRAPSRTQFATRFHTAAQQGASLARSLARTAKMSALGH